MITLFPHNGLLPNMKWSDGIPSGRHNPEIENDVYIAEMDRLREMHEATTTLVEHIGKFDFEGLIDETTNVIHFPQSLDDDINKYRSVLTKNCPVCIAARIPSFIVRNPTTRCCVAWKQCDVIFDLMKIQFQTVNDLRNTLYDLDDMLKKYPLVVASLKLFTAAIDTTIEMVEKRHWHYVYKRANVLKKLWMRYR